MKIRMERAEAETTRAPVAPVSVADLGYAFRSDRIRLEGSPSATRLPFGTDGGWATSIDQALASFRDAVGGVRSDIAPIALCALPFDRSAPGELVIPHEMIIERGGERWIQTVVGTTNDRDSPLLDSAGVTPPRSLVDPTEIAIRSEIDRDVWCDQIRAIVNVINTTELQKAVLFRTLSIHADRDFVPSAIYRRLSKSISTGYAFLVDGFVGVSPELLVERTGDMVRAHPMAGTLPLTGNVEADAEAARQLISDPKMQVEHQITIDRLHDALLGWCSYLDSEPHPSVVAAASVQHLATLVEGRLSDPAPSALELAAALHPTPAVGGWPVQAALDTIAKIESCERGRAAGPVGWVDVHGEGQLAVGIRAAQIEGRNATAYAGVGVVGGSIPEAEFAETQAKFRTVLPALIHI